MLILSKEVIRDYQVLQESMKNQEISIPLAAKTSILDSEENKENVNDVNIKGSQNVVECCVECNITKIIVMSSAAAYGEGEENKKT